MRLKLVVFLSSLLATQANYGIRSYAKGITDANRAMRSHLAHSRFKPTYQNGSLSRDDFMNKRLEMEARISADTTELEKSERLIKEKTEAHQQLAADNTAQNIPGGLGHYSGLEFRDAKLRKQLEQLQEHMAFVRKDLEEAQKVRQSLREEAQKYLLWKKSHRESYKAKAVATEKKLGYNPLRNRTRNQNRTGFVPRTRRSHNQHKMSKVRDEDLVDTTGGMGVIENETEQNSSSQFQVDFLNQTMMRKPDPSWYDPSQATESMSILDAFAAPPTQDIFDAR